MTRLITNVRRLAVLRNITCDICGGSMVHNGSVYVCNSCGNQAG